MDFESLNIKPEDLSYRVARNAHQGTSFSPEERARQEQQDYYNDIKNVYNLFAGRVTPDKEALFMNELKAYIAANLSYRLGYLYSRSRVMSPMITGPSKFPTRRNEKHSRAYENKVQAFIEWRTRVIGRIGKALGLSSGTAISSDDKDAGEQLQTKIALLEKKQKRMKEINALWRKGGGKPESLREAGVTDSERDEIVSHIKYGMADVPYPSWSLSNNNANIRRLKERLEALQKKRSDHTTETTLKEVRIVDNVEDNRIQIFFPGKPSENIRSELKRNGFKWAPPVGAWQRMRSSSATERATQIVSLYNQQGEQL